MRSKPSLAGMKILLSNGILTAGFALISAGFGEIFGVGAGMLTAGVSLIGLQWVVFGRE